MAYSKFTLSLLQEKFSIDDQAVSLFAEIQTIQPSAWLLEAMEFTKSVPLLSEKARSEQIVTPILNELVKRNPGKIAVYSGIEMDADAENGLSGECDFLISSNPKIMRLSPPIISLVEAKEQSIKLGTPQCIAQMLGARIFNQKNNKPMDRIYGCVTTGEDWRFLLLEGNIVYIDNKNYYINDLPTLLGVFQFIINQYI